MQDGEKNKHNLKITDRKYMEITGVIDVISFDEEMIVAETELGVMILKGLNFHISKLNLDSGDLKIDGEIYNIIYENKDAYGKPANGIFSKIFK